MTPEYGPSILQKMWRLLIIEDVLGKAAAYSYIQGWCEYYTLRGLEAPWYLQRMEAKARKELEPRER